MAISDAPESIGTTAAAITSSIRSDSDLNQSSVRRRPSSTGLFRSSVRVGDGFETESSGEELIRDSSSDDSMNTKSSEHDKDRNKVDATNSILNDKTEKSSNKERAMDFAAVKFFYRPSAPALSQIKESPLSSDNIFRQSHAGLFNLCIVVLVAVNSRLIIENLMKYGWLIKVGFWFSSKSLRDWPRFMCCLSLAIFPFAAFIAEKLAQKKCISDPIVVLLHILITTAAVLYPVFVILREKHCRIF